MMYDKQNKTYEKISQQQVFQIINRLSSSHRRVLNLIINLSNKYKCLYIRQDTIARSIKLCRQRVNEIIQDLKSLLLIDSWYRHMTSCVYSINTIFNDFTLRIKLSQLLPALGLFTIAWLYAPHRETTQLVLDNNNYISFLTDTKRRDAEILEKREIEKKEELKRERLRTNVSKLFDKVVLNTQKREMQRLKAWRSMKYDDESQPKHENKKRPEAYKTYIHKKRDIDILHEATTWDNSIKNADERFKKMMGSDYEEIAKNSAKTCIRQLMLQQ